MANALTTSDGISASTLEHVLGTGDLSKLTVPQRVEYYLKTCQSLGLNPATQPFAFMNFQGKTVMYARKDAADQLRATRKISLSLPEKQLDGDLFIVTARATSQDGRSDEDVGAIVLGKLQGEARANAIMKAITKAKRRVTLSICGLGFLDETEVETLQGASTFAASDEMPVSKMPAEAASPSTFGEAVTAELENEPNGTKWLNLLGFWVNRCATADELAIVRSLPSTKNAVANAPSLIRAQIADMMKAAVDRLAPQPNAPVADVTAAVEMMFDHIPPADDEMDILEAIKLEIAAITTEEGMTEWSMGPIQAVMADLRKTDQAKFQRALAIIDERRIQLES